MNELGFLCNLSSSTNEEDKEKKNAESQLHIEKIESQLENKWSKSSISDHSSLQDPHFPRLNLEPMNYFIPNIDMRNFDGNDTLTWIFKM